MNTDKVLNSSILNADTPHDLASEMHEIAEERIIISLTKEEAVVLLAAPLPDGKLGSMIGNLREALAESLLDMITGE